MTRRTEYVLAFAISAWFIITSVVMISVIEADAERQWGNAVPLAAPRAQVGVYAAGCWPLYEDPEHTVWFECMRVGYVSPDVRSQMKRDDL